MGLPGLGLPGLEGITGKVISSNDGIELPGRGLPPGLMGLLGMGLLGMGGR